jgi:peptidoglycan hydrolase-like protein with peptidoglycan-binding domain
VAARQLPAVAAAALIGAVVIAGVAGGFGGGGGGGGEADDSTTTMAAAASSTSSAPTTAAATSAAPTTAAEHRTTLSQPLGMGSAGTSVQNLQERLKELGFEPGPADGSFGLLTQQAVWAFEKLVLGVPRGEATGVVTDEMWQRMQDDIRIEPRRKASEGRATRNHTEVYLPEQVVIFFVNDEPVLISHMSSGDGEEYREMVTIDPGEARNENGTEPIELKLLGVAFTPGGVFTYDRFVQGRRQSALGGMYDPGYFNYGIAIHGALDIPLHPASHGCIRLPMYIGERYQEHVAKGDQVFVFDGEHEPEYYGEQLPIFDRIDPEWAASTTTTTEPASTTTKPPTTVPQATRPPQTQAPQTQPPQTQPPRTNPPVTTPAPTPAPPTTTTTTAAPEPTTTTEAPITP